MLRPSTVPLFIISVYVVCSFDAVACRFRSDGRTVVAAVRFVIEDLLSAQHPLFVSYRRALSDFHIWDIVLFSFCFVFFVSLHLFVANCRLTLNILVLWQCKSY